MPRKRRQTDTPSLSTEVDYNDTEKYNIESAIKKQFAEYVKKKKSYEVTNQNLTDIVEEHLSSFVILGYTYDGDPVNIVSVENQQDADAIGTMIHRFIMNSQSSRRPPSIDY